jgi:Phosphate-selective porin O and P
VRRRSKRAHEPVAVHVVDAALSPRCIPNGTKVEASSIVSFIPALVLTMLVATPVIASADDEKKKEKHEEKKDDEKTEEKTEEKKDGEKKEKAPKKQHGTFELHARAIVRAAVTKIHGGGEATGALAMQSARLKADYRWKDQVRARLDVELAGKARLKTTFVQVRLYDDEVQDGGTKIVVRAGKMKMPFSGIELDSSWNLPMADRGLLHEVLAKRMQVAGRAIGATVIADLPGSWSPSVSAGMFQGTDDAGDALAVTAGDRFGQDGVLRVTVKPTPCLELGAAGEMRVGKLLVLPAVVRRAWASELDLAFTAEAGPGQFRAWLEGMVGTSWLVADPAKAKAYVAEARGIASYHIGDTKFGSRYVEPFAMIGALDPDLDITTDHVLEMTGGVSYGASRAWRLQLEVEHWRIGRNAPLGIVELGIAAVTSTTVLLQLGAQL